MSQTKQPTHEDAMLALKLFELRREPVMRSSRDALNFTFWPKSIADVEAVTNNVENPLNLAFRQVSSFWEMAYNFARAGVIDPDFLIESNGSEGLFLFAKLQPFLAEMRKSSPTTFQNCEWMVNNSEAAKKRLSVIRQRIEAMGK